MRLSAADGRRFGVQHGCFWPRRMRTLAACKTLESGKLRESSIDPWSLATHSWTPMPSVCGHCAGSTWPKKNTAALASRLVLSRERAPQDSLRSARSHSEAYASVCYKLRSHAAPYNPFCCSSLLQPCFHVAQCGRSALAAAGQWLRSDRAWFGRSAALKSIVLLDFCRDSPAEQISTHRFTSQTPSTRRPRDVM